MKQPLMIKRLKAGLKSDETGNKANSLVFLHRYGFNIPLSFFVTTGAHERYLKEGQAVVDELRKEVEKLPRAVYAVRSSTNAEDSKEFSFAGQFQTLINISGTDEIVRAIREVWDSASMLSDNVYLKKTGITSIRCGVIIQEMIISVLAGVSFSRNPVTNQNEVVIEAVEGQGEELVQKGITPLRWRIRKDIVVEGNEHHHYFSVVRQVATDTMKLKRYYGQHADIEWAYDGHKIYYLQLRQITGRKDIQIYSNKMAKEMLPGQIKPLVWSVNIPLVNSTWIGLLAEITGPLDIRPEDLAKPFYYQAYFNVVALGKIFSRFGMSADSLEYLMIRDDNSRPDFKPGIKTLRHTFRMIRFIFHKLRFEKTLLRESDRLKIRYRELEELIETGYSLQSFNDIYLKLFDEGKRLAYLNIVVPILMSMYHKSLKKRLAKLDFDYDRLDFRADFPELADFNPLPGMTGIKEKIDDLPENIKEHCTTLEKLRSVREASEVAAAIDDFLRRFGHLSESGTDISFPKWEEDPEQVFRMIVQSVPAGPAEMVTFRELSGQGIKISRSLEKTYRKAGRFKVHRERISSFYIYGYGLFRRLFLKLADDLVREGVIAVRDDIFYLTKPELEVLSQSADYLRNNNYRELIEKRRVEMEATRDIVLPPVIYGEEAPIPEEGRVKNHAGLGTSSGSFTGVTRVVKRVGDFDSVQKGDILLIPFSDVSWTPVLVRAGGIVSETGGMLSHCSIIAREMGIPALVSVANACSLGSGLKATVDGSNGILTIHDYE